MIRERYRAELASAVGGRVASEVEMRVQPGSFCENRCTPGAEGGFGVPARRPQPMPRREIETWTPRAAFVALRRLAIAWLVVPDAKANDRA